MNRSTLIMLILVIGVGGFYYFHDVRGSKQREEAEKQEKRLFATVKKEEVTGLEVTHPLKPDSPPLTLERRDGRWVRKGPPDELMAVAEVGTMADSLIEVQRAQVVQEKPAPKQLTQYGLEKPAHQLVLKAGARLYTLFIGDKTPDGGNYYVRVAPDGDVVTIPATLATVLEKSPADLREKSVLPVEPGKVRKVVLVRGGQTVELALEVEKEEKKEDEDEFMSSLEGTWKMLKPLQVNGDAGRISSYLWEWKSLNAGRFLQPDEKADFSKPELRLEVWVDERKTPQILEVGQPVAVQPQMRYVRRLDPEEVMVADFSKSELLTRDSEYFRDRHLLSFQVDEIEKVEGKVEAIELSARRSGADWKVDQPKDVVDDAAMRSSAVSNLLWELAEEQWKSEAPKGTALGKERGRLTLLKSKSEKLGTLILGGATPDGKSTYMQVEGNPTVYVVEGDMLKRWSDPLKPMLKSKTPATPTPKAATPTPAR